MGRISEAEIERLKRSVAVEELVRRKGVELRRHGRELIGLCPFHDDHEPSLVVSPEKNLWHCLGACQSGGSVIDLIFPRLRGHGVKLLEAASVARSRPVTRSPAPSATAACCSRPRCT